MMIGKINDMKMKFGRKVTLRKTEKTKVDSEISVKGVIQPSESMSKKAWIWDKATIDCLARIEN